METFTPGNTGLQENKEETSTALSPSLIEESVVNSNDQQVSASGEELSELQLEQNINGISNHPSYHTQAEIKVELEPETDFPNQDDNAVGDRTAIEESREKVDEEGRVESKEQGSTSVEQGVHAEYPSTKNEQQLEGDIPTLSEHNVKDFMNDDHPQQEPHIEQVKANTSVQYCSSKAAANEMRAEESLQVHSDRDASRERQQTAPYYEVVEPAESPVAVTGEQGTTSATHLIRNNNDLVTTMLPDLRPVGDGVGIPDPLPATSSVKFTPYKPSLRKTVIRQAPPKRQKMHTAMVQQNIPCSSVGDKLNLSKITRLPKIIALNLVGRYNRSDRHNNDKHSCSQENQEKEKPPSELKSKEELRKKYKHRKPPPKGQRLYQPLLAPHQAHAYETLSLAQENGTDTHTNASKEQNPWTETDKELENQYEMFDSNECSMNATALEQNEMFSLGNTRSIENETPSEEDKTESSDQDSSAGAWGITLTGHQPKVSLGAKNDSNPRNKSSTALKTKEELRKQYKHRKPPPMVQRVYQPLVFPHRANSYEHISVFIKAQENDTEENPTLSITPMELKPSPTSRHATNAHLYQPLLLSTEATSEPYLFPQKFTSPTSKAHGHEGQTSDEIEGGDQSTIGQTESFSWEETEDTSTDKETLATSAENNTVEDSESHCGGSDNGEHTEDRVSGDEGSTVDYVNTCTWHGVSHPDKCNSQEREFMPTHDIPECEPASLVDSQPLAQTNKAYINIGIEADEQQTALNLNTQHEHATTLLSGIPDDIDLDATFHQTQTEHQKQLQHKQQWYENVDRYSREHSPTTQDSPVDVPHIFENSSEITLNEQSTY